ncbi:MULTISPECIES: hypothetical protein [Thermococcus]|uniref:hypothetical protein n=1 Tax=Thermococcus TaxID=2263 RepID=UPI00064EC9B2|nr:hypothetical protein [Thermococcus kodakarensis]WCN27265.1 hypothetical protein POG15_06420 [Thermococcus kodakarensis]WCN29551.1 hypothetical protein POG21_06415 [Thermococcus kodakarensis]
MEKKQAYRILLVIVILLAVLYTLGVVGILPFEVSEVVTVFMVVLFFVLRFKERK